jgi:hypothetical protein
MRVVSNEDLDVIVTLREAIQTSSIDGVTATTPKLGDPIDLTGFNTFRGQLRASHMTGSSNLTSHSDDDTPRATLSVTILGDAENGQLRVRTPALRLWTMQQSRVVGGVFDITGVDENGVIWSLVTEGEWDLVYSATAPFTPSAASPSLIPPDRFSAPEDLDAVY